MALFGMMMTQSTAKAAPSVSSGTWMYQVSGSSATRTYVKWYWCDPRYPSYVWSYDSKKWVSGSWSAVANGRHDFKLAGFDYVYLHLRLAR
jgi:hypothetical protein